MIVTQAIGWFENEVEACLVLRVAIRQQGEVAR